MKKQKVIQTINEFQKEVDLIELFERLLVTEKIEKGLLQIETGQIVTHEKVVAHFKKKWRK